MAFIYHSMLSFIGLYSFFVDSRVKGMGLILFGIL